MTEYYKYIGNYKNSDFTKDKIYKIKNPYYLETQFNFIDDRGTPSGWCGNNYKNFAESTIELWLKQETKMEFIIGKWYNNPGYFTDSELTWAKCSKIDKTNFRFSEWIANGEYEVKSNYWYYSGEPYEPTDIEEIRQYLPVNHPDLLKNKENMKYLIRILKKHGIK